MLSAQQLRYNVRDVRKFESYFEKPKKKRGRPRKGRRRRRSLFSTAKRLQAKKENSVNQSTISVSTDLKVRIEGVIAAARQKQSTTRINWDIAPHRELRDRLAKSWTNKTDLYREGESFTRFCKRTHINRIVLKRYIDRVAAGEPAKKRGRPTLLSRDVMRHICEGIVFFVFIVMELLYYHYLLVVCMHVIWPSEYSTRNYLRCFAVIKFHDEHSEGLPRRLIIKMVKTAGGGEITQEQAQYAWDQTILPYGKKMGLLTGYVKPQEGSSKRTASGNENLQRRWHEVVTDLFERVKKRATEVLGDEKLVQVMMPSLIANMDEECLHALGKNTRICGSATLKKHNNQKASSRFVP